jgi:hypothetical protein
MTKILIPIVSCLLLGCIDIYGGGEYWGDWSYYADSVTAVTITRDSLRRSVYSTTPEELRNPGKIYVRGNYLYINERYKGVHVIDNTNPSKPNNIAFIHIPGNIDIAMRSSILYADNATDMVAINVSNPKNAVVTNRVERVFPRLPIPGNSYIGYHYPHDSLVIINWKDTVYN